MVDETDRLKPTRSAPGPRGQRLIGSLLDVRLDPLKFVIEAIRDYGDIVGFRLGSKKLYLLGHPDYAKHILCDNHENYLKGLGVAEATPLLGKGLLTSEGDLWASQRRLLQPAFGGDRLNEFAVSTVNHTLCMLEKWQNCVCKGKMLDVFHEMERLTTIILGATLFRYDLSEVVDELIPNLTLMTRWAMSRMTAFLKFPLNVPVARNLQARKALRRVETIVKSMIQRIQNHSDGENDLRALMVSSLVGHNGEQTTQKQLRDEIITLLVAGHETTAVTLAWTWYLLSKHSDVEEKLHVELEKVLGGSTPTLSDLPRLNYLRMLIEEVLRLYPPVWMITRKAINDDRISEYTIPKGSDVLISTYSLHRHPTFWPNPHHFDPERFKARNEGRQPSFSYIPFGAGARSCPGGRVGLTEAMLIVAVIAQRYRLQMLSASKVEPEALLTLRPRHGLEMMLCKRGFQLYASN